MAFFYHEKKLCVGSKKHHISLDDLVQRYGSPLYVYDLDQIKDRVLSLKKSFKNNIGIHYAVKANANLAILKLLRSLDVGLDVVSAGEIRRGMEAGFDPKTIVFSGVGKTKEEIEYAIRCGVKSLNVESVPELERINEIAQRLNKIAHVSLRINPDVDAETHPHISTGNHYNKFGINIDILKQVRSLLKTMDFVHLIGLTFHIGSQMTRLTPIKRSLEVALKTVDSFNQDGFSIEHLSVGGGLGIQYKNEKVVPLNRYAQAILSTVKKKKLEILCEPGRIIVGDAGALVCEVQYIKKARSKLFAIVNTGMHHLMRPALYGAYHSIVSLKKNNSKPNTYEVVGPICESTDVLASRRRLPELKSGDLLAILQAGAYGFSMANHYNLHPFSPEVCVSEGRVISATQLELQYRELQT